MDECSQYQAQDKARDKGPRCIDCGCHVDTEDAGKCDVCLKLEWAEYAPGTCKACGEKEPLLDELCRLCHEAFTYTMSKEGKRLEALTLKKHGEQNND